MLADALWYTQENFKPVAIVDLATLTGAIMVALGQVYGGMFCNDDTLSDRLPKPAKRPANCSGACRWAPPTTS